MLLEWKMLNIPSNHFQIKNSVIPLTPLPGGIAKPIQLPLPPTLPKLSKPNAKYLKTAVLMEKFFSSFCAGGGHYEASSDLVCTFSVQALAQDQAGPGPDPVTGPGTCSY